MAETGDDDVSRAALRSYAVRGLERTAKVSVGPMPRPEVSHDDPLARSDTVQMTLEAFMNSREEDAVSFLASFLQLTPDDRVFALARLEAHEETSCVAGAAAGKERSDASRQAATFAEVRQRLRNHEVQPKQLALTERHTGDVLQRTVDVPFLEIHQCPCQNRQMRLDGATHAVTAKVQCSAACSGEEEGLETIELEEGTRTGNLQAFVDTGVIEMSTNFDNFFDTTATPRAAVGDIQDEARDSLPFLSAQSTLPTLDNILGLDAEEVLNPTTPPIEKVCLSRRTAAREPGVKPSEPEMGPASIRESGAPSLTSSMASMSLPGLEDASLNVGTSEEVSRCTYSTDFFAKIHEVIAEGDGCVEAFALDPLFDYDIDLLGEALRAGTRWRQE
ncbi:hypothetical protein GH5_00642 [Leishmania sp. Ghana 2012 LV757]|uniref:hypothetical protein n=1 Tax=Leishmania sp. Ghana 2012 LV757 TaxID=2803181 RepID=UPI001B576914|nr:hypothetical protein GH5_00642 [Leishmania sp. Ghana 2012 LV757]